MEYLKKSLNRVSSIMPMNSRDITDIELEHEKLSEIEGLKLYIEQLKSELRVFHQVELEREIDITKKLAIKLKSLLASGRHLPELKINIENLKLYLENAENDLEQIEFENCKSENKKTNCDLLRIDSISQIKKVNDALRLRIENFTSLLKKNGIDFKPSLEENTEALKSEIVQKDQRIFQISQRLEEANNARMNLEAELRLKKDLYNEKIDQLKALRKQQERSVNSQVGEPEVVPPPKDKDESSTIECEDLEKKLLDLQSLTKTQVNTLKKTIYQLERKLGVSIREADHLRVNVDQLQGALIFTKKELELAQKVPSPSPSIELREANTCKVQANKYGSKKVGCGVGIVLCLAIIAKAVVTFVDYNNGKEGILSLRVGFEAGFLVLALALSIALVTINCITMLKNIHRTSSQKDVYMDAVR